MNPLLTAASHHDTADLVRLVANGWNVNAADESGRTALFYAVHYMDPNLVGFLLSSGARATIRTKQNWCLLNFALYSAAVIEQRNTVDTLKTILCQLHEAGASYDGDDVRGARAMVEYGSLKMLECFVGQGEPGTPVAELVQYLAQNNTDLNTVDKLGRSRLHKAAEHGSLETVKALLAVGVRVDVNGPLGSALHCATLCSSIDVMQALLEAKADPSLRDTPNGTTPLLCAVMAGNLAAVRLLVTHGARVNERDAIGMGVLHKAIGAWNNDTSPKLFSELVALGADPSAVLDGALPLLHYAARFECVGAMQVLIKHGVDVNTLSADATSVTALHISAMFGRLESIRFLISHGADPLISDAVGALPLSVAIRYDQRDALKLLLELGCAIGARNERGETCMHTAANWATVQVLNYLVTSAGADIKAVDFDGWTPLHFAAHASLPGTVDFLIRSGAEINLQDLGGRTPLHIAVGNRRKESIAQLLAHGAYADLKTKNAQTPLDWAKELAYQEGERILTAAMELHRLV